jgi:hypothetical protein
MLRGHCADTDWLRTGHGLDAAAAIVPDNRQHRLGRWPPIARTLAEKYPAIARTLHRMPRG